MTFPKLISITLITALVLPTSLKAVHEDKGGEQPQHPHLIHAKIEQAQSSCTGVKQAGQPDTEKLRAENNTLKNQNRILGVQNEAQRHTITLVLACLITESVLIAWGIFTGLISINGFSQS